MQTLPRKHGGVQMIHVSPSPDVVHKGVKSKKVSVVHQPSILCSTSRALVKALNSIATNRVSPRP